MVVERPTTVENGRRRGCAIEAIAMDGDQEPLIVWSANFLEEPGKTCPRPEI